MIDSASGIRAGAVPALLLILALGAGAGGAGIELSLFAVTDTCGGTPNTAAPGTARGVFGIGETVRVTFKLVNSGDTADVDIICWIRDHATGRPYTCYDSDDARKTSSGAWETHRIAGVARGAVLYASYDYVLPRWAAVGAWDIGGFVRDTWAPGHVYTTTAPGVGSVDWTDMWRRGWLTVVTATAPRDVLVLLYHSIGASTTSTSFYAHLAAMSAYRYSAITPDEFLDYRAGRASLPAKPVMLTFDGGYQTHYDVLLPMLLKAGYAATFFVVTDQIGETERVSKRMIWPEVAALRDQGMVIGSHSVTHTNPLDLSPAALAAELTVSKSIIEKRLGCECAYFCYPLGGGAHDSRIQAQVRDAGYRGAFSITELIENTGSCVPASIRRIQAEGLTWTSAALDNSAPDMFFMRKIDRGFPIPALRIADGYPRFRDAAGVYRTTFCPGETIVAEFQVANAGDPTGVVASLELDADTRNSTPPKFDSRASVCDAVFARMDRTAQTFSYVWTVPLATRASTFYYRLTQRDLYGVLIFHSTGWLPGFDVTAGTVARTLSVWTDPAGAAIVLAPVAATGAGGGDTPFQRVYSHGTSVTATAPSSLQGKTFQRWQLDGTELDPAPSGPCDVVFAMDGNHTLTAVYGSTVGDTEPPALTARVPAPGAWRVRLTDLIRARIEDAGAGVDSSTVRIEARVEDDPWQLVSDGSAEFILPGRGDPDFLGVTRRSGTTARYVYEFEPSPAANVGYGRNVRVRVTARDFAGNALTTNGADWTFTTEARSFGRNLAVSSGPARNDRAAAAVDANGAAWVAWERSDSRGVGSICLAKRTVGEFTPPWEVLPSSMIDRRSPALLSDGATLYLAWVEKDVVTGHHRVRVCKSGTAVRPFWTDLGDPGIASALDVRHPRLAVDALGELHLVALAAGPQGVNVVAASRGLTGAWTTVQLASDADDVLPQADFGGDDTLVASWLAGGKVCAAARVAGVWSAPAQLTSGGHATGHAIALERRGGAHPVLHLAWVEGPDPADLRYAQTDGAVLSAPASSVSVLDGAPAAGMRPATPSMRVDDAGRDALVFLVWQDGRMTVNGDRDIFFAEKRGRYPFSANQRLDDDTNNAVQSSPALGVDAQGNPYAVWTDERTAPAHIRFCGATGNSAVGKPWRVGAAGGKRVFAQSGSRQLRLMSVDAPPGVFTTPRELRVGEAVDPAGFPRPGNGLCLQIDPGIDEPLGDWITVTFYDVLSVPSPMEVYRYVPPANPLESGRWTHELIRGESYDPDARVFSFQTKHLSSFDVGVLLGPPGMSGTGGSGTGGGGGGGGGCSVGNATGPGWTMLLPPAAAVALWFGRRLRRSRRLRWWF